MEAAVAVTHLRRTSPARRGAALLLVLAMLVIAVSSATVLVSVAGTHRARAESLQTTNSANQLLAAADPRIQAWLGRSRSVVLPIEAPIPAVEVIDDRWTSGDIDYRIRITAFDQCGMLPIELASSSSPLRLVIDPVALDAVRDLEGAKANPTGLDQVISAAMPIYPLRSGDQPAVGALIATHPTGGVNVNTAPWPLVQATGRALGQSGALSIVEAARSAGEAASFSAQPSQDAIRDTPALVSSSSSWAMRIIIEVGPTNHSPLRRSWWAIYQRRGGQWTCTQRLAIDR